MEPKWVAMIGVAVVAVLALPLVLADKANMKNYEKVEMGMTYDEVKGILGSGKTIDEIDPPKPPKDLPPGMPKPTKEQMKQAMQQAKRMFDSMGMEVYIWQRGDEKQISVIMRNGKVAAKSQIGFADRPSFESVDGGAGGMPGFPGGAGMPGSPPGLPAFGQPGGR